MKINIKQWIKNAYIRLRFYGLGSEHPEGNQLIFFVQDGYPQPHPGLVDRFKAVVGQYYIAKQNGFEFRLVYDSPFELEKYLQPNICQWNQTGSVSKRGKDVKLFRYGGFRDIPKLSKEIPQYHCYYYEGLNILRSANIVNWERKWGELYRELFRPSDYLESLLKKYIPERPYIAVHTRFVNALENFEKGYESYLTEKEKEELIQKCLKAIGEIVGSEKKDIYVFSDSIRFLKEVQKAGYQTLPIENIGHISFQTDESVHDKTFIDFYVMSLSDKVYSLQGKNVYASVFSQYASIVGDKEYEIKQID